MCLRCIQRIINNSESNWKGGRNEHLYEDENPPSLNKGTVEFSNLIFHSNDICEAIESIPNGASPGPDGISTILLKKLKSPLSRILCKILRNSIDTGDIPDILKQALIIPIFKGGSRLEACNYRPISLTSHIMKIFERVIRKSLVNYLECESKFSPNQHGSRSKRSTLSQLLQHHEEILKSLEDGNNVDCVYLDFAKAYDKVDHGVLLHKLKQVGIVGPIGRWIHNFLTNRKQQVMIKGRKSKISYLKSGVPQGSVLGPLLFLIYIGDIADNVDSEVLVYVDDSKIKKNINQTEDVEQFQNDLDTLYIWAQANNMKFNGEKFLVLRYGKNQELKENTSYFTENMNDVIMQVNKCRDLGIIMNDAGNFTDHIETVCTKVRQKIGWILRTFYTRDSNFLKHMFKTLVQPIIDYCSQLWAPNKGAQLKKIEDLLRTFTRQIPNIKHMNYWDRLKWLKMNSEQRRFERYRIIYVWKMLENLVPNCGVKVKSTGRTGRTLVVPTSKSKERESSFLIQGPKLFNSLPREIKDMSGCGLEKFKEALDNFLTEIPDEPPAPGLIPGACSVDALPSNSLLDQIPRSGRNPTLVENIHPCNSGILMHQDS